MLRPRCKVTDLALSKNKFINIGLQCNLHELTVEEGEHIVVFDCNSERHKNAVFLSLMFRSIMTI